MKLINRLTVLAIVIGGVSIAGCTDNVYDPDKKPQTPPAENPFGEGFIAPEGFDWSMINTVKLNVEVKDERMNLMALLITSLRYLLLILL